MGYIPSVRVWKFSYAPPALGYAAALTVDCSRYDTKWGRINLSFSLCKEKEARVPLGMAWCLATLWIILQEVSRPCPVCLPCFSRAYNFCTTPGWAVGSKFKYSGCCCPASSFAYSQSSVTQCSQAILACHKHHSSGFYSIVSRKILVNLWMSVLFYLLF